MADAFANRERLKCSRCGNEMEETARIAPFGAEPSLRIFECPTCGAKISRPDEYPHAPYKSEALASSDLSFQIRDMNFVTSAHGDYRTDMLPILFVPSPTFAASTAPSTTLSAGGTTSTAR